MVPATCRAAAAPTAAAADGPAANGATKIKAQSYFDLSLNADVNDNFGISIGANNILDKKYSSNGYMWDVYPYYYPQAGTNFLAGLTLKF